MKNKKRILIITIPIILILKIILIIQLSPTRLVFQKIPTGYAVVDVRGNPREIIIPTHHNELPVIEIGVRAFSSERRLEVVRFEEGSNVRIIRRLAFSNNRNLRYFYLPDSVTHLENHVFNNSFNLSKVTISHDANLQHIGGSAFFQTNLKTIYLPASLISIGSLAFFNNRNLKIVDFINANSLTTISDDAFSKTPFQESEEFNILMNKIYNT